MNTLDENENIFDELKEKLDQSEDYYETAGAGKRLINYFIDLAAFYFITFVFAFVLAASGAVEIDDGVSYILVFGIMIVYYTTLEHYLGQTIGKIITKTKVVDEFGGKPTFSQILGRTFSRFIPFEAFSFLGSGWGWHDRIPGTKVVIIEKKNIQELV